MFCFCLCLPANELAGAEAQYETAPLSEKDWREISAWSNYARAAYLISEGKAELLPELRDYLKACLMDLPDAKIPLYLLLNTFAESEQEQALQTLAEILAVNPENEALNLLYIEALVENEQSVEACERLYELARQGGWQKPELVARLLYLHIAAGRFDDAGDLIAKLRKQKVLRQHPLFQLMQAWHLIKNRESGSELSARTHRQIAALLAPVIQSDELKSDRNLFNNTFRVLYDYEQWDTLQRILDQVPEQWKAEPIWLMNKLLVFEQQKDADGLYAFSKQLWFDMQGLHPAVLAMLRKSFFDMGNLPYAIEVQELLLRNNPQMEGERTRLGMLYAAHGNYKKALEMLEPLKNSSLEVIIIVANIYCAMHDYTQAMAGFKRAEEIAAKSTKLTELSQLDGNFYARYALCALFSGNVEMALKLYEQAYKLAPDSANVCNAYGYTLADENMQLPFAKELIENALRQEPDNVAYLDSFAWVLYRMQKQPEALQAMLRTIIESGLSGLTDKEIWEHAAKIFAANELEILAEFYQWKAESLAE